ncbi:hypothetical protein DENSPDRAFT_307740 [Dentipellis sp. KUC8613]|nr:hypothetical protein DENSPDRAFT_307740 [Dentipellis sp. KUC8613]
MASNPPPPPPLAPSFAKSDPDVMALIERAVATAVEPLIARINAQDRKIEEYRRQIRDQYTSAEQSKVYVNQVATALKMRFGIDVERGISSIGRPNNFFGSALPLQRQVAAPQVPANRVAPAQPRTQPVAGAIPLATRLPQTHAPAPVPSSSQKAAPSTVPGDAPPPYTVLPDPAMPPIPGTSTSGPARAGPPTFTPTTAPGPSTPARAASAVPATAYPPAFTARDMAAKLVHFEKILAFCHMDLNSPHRRAP